MIYQPEQYACAECEVRSAAYVATPTNMMCIYINVHRCSIYMCVLYIPDEIRTTRSRSSSAERTAFGSLSFSFPLWRSRSVLVPNPFTCTRRGHRSIAHLFTHTHRHTPAHGTFLLCFVRRVSPPLLLHVNASHAHSHTHTNTRAHLYVRTQTILCVRSDEENQSGVTHRIRRTRACALVAFRVNRVPSVLIDSISISIEATFVFQHAHQQPQRRITRSVDRSFQSV